MRFLGFLADLILQCKINSKCIFRFGPYLAQATRPFSLSIFGAGAFGVALELLHSQRPPSFHPLLSPRDRGGWTDGTGFVQDALCGCTCGKRSATLASLLLVVVRYYPSLCVAAGSIAAGWGGEGVPAAPPS